MAEASRDFRGAFDPEKQSIEGELAALNTLPPTKVQAATDILVQRIHALEKSVTVNIAVLPPYDARVCLEAVKTMSGTLNELRVKLIPKPKFSFKSRKALSSPSSPSTLAVSKPTRTPDAAPAVDQSLFMKFEDRTGEHLFIGHLTIPTTTTLLEEDVYLGGVLVDAHLTVPIRDDAKDVALTNLTDCTINLVHDIPLGAIHIKNLKRCVLVIPPVSGSILLHDCEGCVLIGACHQSRMHTSTNMDIYLHVTSEPIIEDCTDMRFAPYPYHDLLPVSVTDPDRLTRLFKIAKLNPQVNYFDQVKDFNWLRQQKSPNWRVMEESERRIGMAQSVLAKDQVGGGGDRTQQQQQEQQEQQRVAAA